MAIELKNVSHSYSRIGLSNIAALNDANLHIEEGQFIGIIGHTGSGKTTFVQHLNGLLHPTSGEVFVDGVKIGEDKAALKAIRKKVGLVFQYPENQLFEETIYKDIAFGPLNLGLSKAEADQRVREAMEKVALDFDKYAQVSPFEISGGQMRRVAIAGVIAMHPKYLVLDEPTAGLDPHGRDKILKMIYELHRDNNITVIMVTHNMDEIAWLADRLILFYKGSIVADDTPEAIFQDEDKLKEIGLGVPQVATLAHKLRKKGIVVPKNIYRMEDMKQALLQLNLAKL